MFLMVSDASSKVEQPEISDYEQEPGIGRWKGALYVACGVATLYEDDAEPGTGKWKLILYIICIFFVSDDEVEPGIGRWNGTL